MEKQIKKVKLSDGREVSVSETTGMDEMIASKIAGEKANSALGYSGNASFILLAISLVEIDGRKQKRPTSLLDVQTFFNQFKSKDLRKLQQAYTELNTDPGEFTATVS
jgi:predicted house-cleaning NTP pyrophosphatase (Maf/HAM1 superfamily)